VVSIAAQTHQSKTFPARLAEATATCADS